MKILLFNPIPCRSQTLRESLVKAGHVVRTCGKLRQLLREIVSYEPNVVVSHEQNGSNYARSIQRRVEHFQCNTVFEAIPSGSDVTEALGLIQAAGQRWKPGSANPTSSATCRLEIRDSDCVEWQECNRRRIPKDPDFRCGQTRDAVRRLFAQMVAAQQNLAAAREYWNAVDRAHNVLIQDSVHQTIGETGRLYALAAQSVRWLSVLAHFGLGVELPCLPQPQPISPVVDFSSRALSDSPGAIYAVSVVLRLGIKPVLIDPLVYALGWTIYQKTREDAVERATKLLGLNCLFREASVLQLAVMQLLTDKAGASAMAWEDAPQHRRLLQQYCDLWNYPTLRDHPEVISDVVEQFAAGTKVDLQAQLAPSFARMCREHFNF